jgi:hypothetical protein
MTAILEILMPILLTVFLVTLIYKLDYFKNKSISANFLIVAFLLKCISSIYFGYLFSYNIINGGDTFSYVKNADIIFQSSKTSWWHYFLLVFGRNDFSNPAPQLLSYINNMDFWYDQSNYFMVRLNAIIRLFSFGIYNVHAIVFAFISFIGVYNLYLFFEEKVFNKNILKIILFGIPSIVFWTSGVHKEAIVIYSLGTILLNFERLMQNSLSKKYLLYVIIGLLMLGFIRFYVLAFLIPLALSIIVFNTFNLHKNTYKVYFISSFIIIALFAIFNLIFPEYNILNEISIRRTHFLELQGNTSFSVVKDFNHFSGFIALILDSIINPFVHPFPNESSFILVILASIETYLILFVIVALLLSVNYKNIKNNPYALFCILFSLSLFFLIGLIVNNSGAIVRYRSIAIPFLLIGLCLTFSKNKESISTQSQFNL